MFKKIKIFLFSSLASLMATNSVLSAEKNTSYAGLSYLSDIDRRDSEIVTASNGFTKKLPNIIENIFGVVMSAVGIFNIIPFITRIGYGKAKFDDAPVRLQGFKDNDLANHVLDAFQVVGPLCVSYLCFCHNKKQKVYQEHYLKKLLLGLDDNYDNNVNDRKVTVVNNYNYYNISPEKKV